MKLIDNIEFSHAKEVVISRKVFYLHVGDNWVRDDTRTVKSTIENDGMPDCMSANEMAEYIRDYIGVKRWKIVLSSGTVNIFKPKKHKPDTTNGIVITFKAEEKPKTKKAGKK